MAFSGGDDDYGSAADAADMRLRDCLIRASNRVAAFNFPLAVDNIGSPFGKETSRRVPPILERIQGARVNMRNFRANSMDVTGQIVADTIDRVIALSKPAPNSGWRDWSSELLLPLQDDCISIWKCKVEDTWTNRLERFLVYMKVLNLLESLYAAIYAESTVSE